MGVSTKGAYLGGASTRDIYTGGACARGACIKDICIKSICTRSFYAKCLWVRNAYTCAGSVCIRAWDAFGTGTCIGSACVNNISAIERFGMYLQFFQNLEVRGTELEIQVRAN